MNTHRVPAVPTGADGFIFVDNLLIIRKYVTSSVCSSHCSKPAQQIPEAAPKGTGCFSQAATTCRETHSVTAEQSASITCTGKGFGYLHLGKPKILRCDTAHKRVLAPYKTFPICKLRSETIQTDGCIKSVLNRTG